MSDKYTISCGRPHRRAGLMLVELVLVFVVIGLLMSLVAINPVAQIQQARGSKDVFRLAHTLRLAAENAVIQGKQFAVVIDITDGSYAVYKLDKGDSFYDEPQEPGGLREPGELREPDGLREPSELREPREPRELLEPGEQRELFIKQGYLKDNYIEQIGFEDGSYKLSGELVLYATAQGWDRSVIFTLINSQTEQHKFLRCDRYTTNVKSSGRPIKLLEPMGTLAM